MWYDRPPLLQIIRAFVSAELNCDLCMTCPLSPLHCYLYLIHWSMLEKIEYKLINEYLCNICRKHLFLDPVYM